MFFGYDYFYKNKTSTRLIILFILTVYKGKIVTQSKNFANHPGDPLEIAKLF